MMSKVIKDKHVDNRKLSSELNKKEETSKLKQSR